MSGRRLFAIGVILVLASLAWFVLAGSVGVRTTENSSRLGDEVGGLWGTAQTQAVPSFSAVSAARKPVTLELVGSDVEAEFESDRRRKGLLWYATYVVDFSARYRVSNPASGPVDATMRFTFPDAAGSYDGFAVEVDGVEAPLEYAEGAASASFVIPAGSVAEVKTGYRANGMDSWTYQPSPGGAAVIRDCSLTMDTDFAAIDYPDSGMSPTSRKRTGDGWKLVWDYDSVVSGRDIGVIMPKPMNPGPLVTRITAFAPVSLLFFFAALVLLTATRSVKLHPVHYGFLAAAFFAFHLLLAYLADQVDINMAFAIATVTSVVLVFGYLRAVVGTGRVLTEIAISQLVFLVLFSYSFFFEGYTGLAITVGSVLTLAFFMAKTVGVDWEDVFPPRPPKTPWQSQPWPPLPPQGMAPGVVPDAAQGGQVPPSV